MSRFDLRGRRLPWLMVAGLMCLGAAAALFLQPPAPATANSTYMANARTQFPSIVGTPLDSCTLCHLGSPPARNPYGDAYRNAGHNFTAIQNLDSDGDGYSNLAEIQGGTFPGDAASHLGAATATATRTSVPPTATNTPLPGSTPARTPTGVPPPANTGYRIIGWNDLGMHCTNQNFSNLALLPPYNNLFAEVIRQGSEPQLVTSGVIVEYSIEGNTYSVGKSNFWQYAEQLFGLAQPLPANVGLTGAGLSGQMIAQPGGYFKIEGIPLTMYRDSAPTTAYPYQLAHLVAKDAATGRILAETRPVAPTSTEMHCEACHSDGQQRRIATGNVETNILTLHDTINNTTLMNRRPVLCATCHASNALGMAGVAGVENMSLAMHNKHSQVFPTPNTMENTCYQCHPGTLTQCLRDVMGAAGQTCINCHGDLKAVANPARNPWLDEPKCGDCHGANYAENAGQLYRNSKGHGGLYCETCHGSPHAILPSQQANDNIQNIALQGHAGTLDDCRVCHGTTPNEAGPHGIRATPPGSTATPVQTATATPRVSPTATRRLSPTATRRVTATATPRVSPTATRRVTATPTVDDDSVDSYRVWLPSIVLGQ